MYAIIRSLMNDDKTKNLWILAEERPKVEVLIQILKKFAADNKFSGFVDNLRILPILEKNKFTFTYEIVGFRCSHIKKIYIKTVSGYSSFVDFLVFFQCDAPNPDYDVPMYAIEETKTDDSESRNTGVYQRCSKFVYIESFYPSIRKIMLYNLKNPQKKKPTKTNIFGTRMLLTNGVEVLGKELDNNVFKPFLDVDELIRYKETIRKPTKGNVPIDIVKSGDQIFISGRLWKGNALAHDPNIGALSIISSTLRKLGWKNEIVITNHGLSQNNLTHTNKFVIIANKLNLLIENLELTNQATHLHYWKYDDSKEKLGTIFIHLVVEGFTQGYSIYENHAGSERGYFLTSEGKNVAVGKYEDRDKYKNGDKTKIINIPDLTILDIKRKQIINVEGETYKNKKNGILQLALFEAFEKLYVKKSYENFTIIRTVVLYGGSGSLEQFEVQIGFILSKNGDMVLGISAPEIFKEAIKHLLDFWN